MRLQPKSGAITSIGTPSTSRKNSTVSSNASVRVPTQMRMIVYPPMLWMLAFGGHRMATRVEESATGG